MFPSSHGGHKSIEAFKPRILVLVSDDDEDPEFSCSRYCVVETEHEIKGSLRHFYPFSAA
jgi:hypothetical protein